VGVEVMELVRQNVGIRNEIELLPTEPFLHLHVVVAKAILSRYFVALREVIDSLELI